MQTLQKVDTLTGHTDAVRALCVANGRLFSGSYDSTLRVSLLRGTAWLACPAVACASVCHARC